MLPVSVWRVLAAALGLALVPAQYQVTRSDPLARLAGVLRSAKRRYLSVSTIDIRAILDIVVFISIFRVFNMSGQAGTNVTLSCPANTKVTSKYLDKLNHSQCPSFTKISIMQKSKYLCIYLMLNAQLRLPGWDANVIRVDTRTCGHSSLHTSLQVYGK